MKRSNLLISLLAGVIIVLFAWQRLQVIEPKGVKIEAKVTEIIQNTPEEYRITVSYHPKRHETFQGSFSLSEAPSYEIGDTIFVLYQVDNIKNVIPLVTVKE